MNTRQRGIYNTKKKEPQRKELRNSTTSAEAVLWTYLQKRQILGKKFRRQHSIGPYIVDFYCPECRVVVELDGAPHFSILVEEYEERRARYLQERGVEVIRFENKLVFKELDGVLEAIREKVRNQMVSG